MVYVRLLIIFLLASQIVIATAAADDRANLRKLATLSGQKDAGRHATKDVRMTAATPLDRVATAVDGAESSHSSDIGMWRPDPSAPQGPMRVSEAAATDVGGGDRFDPTQNRAMGRAYLAQLYGRYRNWPDAIAAYNWGIGKMDAWVKLGRPPDRFLVGVETYLRRVLHDSGLCNGTEPKRLQQLPGTADRSNAFEAARDVSTGSICAHFYDGRSFNDRAPGRPRSPFEREAASARSSWITAMRGSFGCTITSGASLRCR